MTWCLIHGYLNASKCLDSKKFIKINVLQTSMSDWKIELFTYNNHLESMSMKRGIFLKDLFYSVVPYAILHGSQDAGKRVSLGKRQT